MAGALSVAFDVLLASGVVLLGVGFLWRDRRAHLARAAGWSVFGVFWFLHVGEYANVGDALNALGAAAALPVFLFIGYHEWLSYEWNEEYEPLRFAGGAAFFASAVYFAFARVPELAAVLNKAVADQTAWAMNGLGFSYAAGVPTCSGDPTVPISQCPNGEAVTVAMVRLNAGSSSTIVNIVLACTAIQAYAVAASLMLTTRDPWRRKALALGIVVPVTYVMNLVRNVVIIYFFGERNDPFELVHNWYGKTLSLAVLLVLVFVAFRLLPELYLNINGLFELPWRRSPRHDYLKYVGRLRRKREPTTPARGGSPPATAPSTGGTGRTPPSAP